MPMEYSGMHSVHMYQAIFPWYTYYPQQVESSRDSRSARYTYLNR